MELREQIEQVIENEPVALFMKGTPQLVMCGNSQRALEALRRRRRAGDGRRRPPGSPLPPGAVGDLGLADDPAGLRQGRAARRRGHRRGAGGERRARAEAGRARWATTTAPRATSESSRWRRHAWDSSPCRTRRATRRVDDGRGAAGGRQQDLRRRDAAVDAMSLEVNDGEFMVLVGPSGCGKTTALRMVAGLEEISEGTLRIGDRVVNDLTPRERDIAMVFQSYALYPHLSVYDNIAFSLKLHKLPKAEIDKRVQDAARILDLEPFLKRKPKALSGGQRQRVAMGRAIVRQPSAFLMDEPLSNLDAKLRVQMRAEISELQRNLGVTTIYVTHDQIEAMTMGDRVAVMRKGELQQADEPQELYDHPVNLFVAGFIGSPAMNLLEATLQRDNGEHEGRRRLAADPARATRRSPSARRCAPTRAGRSCSASGRRTSRTSSSRANRPHGGRLNGTVTLREALGVGDHGALLASTRTAAITEDVKELAEDVGDDRVAEGADGRSRTVLVGRFGARSRVGR